jgi:hypothetical protein
MMMIQQNK